MSEVVLVDRHTVQNLGVDLLVFDIDQVHLLTNTLHGSFGTEGGNVRTDKTMRLAGNRFRLNVLIQLHVTRVDTKYFKAAVFVRNSDIDLTVEASKATEGGIHRVGAVRSTNHNDRSTLLEAVHKGQHLTHNTTFDFTVGFLTFGSDRIDLVNENNGRGVLLCFFKGLAEVGFGLTGHLTHDLRAVDKEKECSRLIGNRPSNQCLSGTRGSVEQDSARGLDAERLEQHRVTKGQLDHFANLSHLLAAATNVVVADVVHLLLVFALDGVAFAMNHRIGSHDTVGRRVCFDHFELHRVHRLAHQKEISLLDGAVSFQEVGLEVDIKEVAAHTFNRVIQGENVDALSVGNISTAGDSDNVGETDTQVLTDDLVHANGRVIARLIRQDNTHSVAPLLSLDEDRVSTKKLELLHLGRGEGDDRVVVVCRIVDNQAIGTTLLASRCQDRVLHVFVLAAESKKKNEEKGA